MVSNRRQYARKECSPFAVHAACGNAEQRRRALSHWSSSGRAAAWSTALHKSDGARDVHKCWHVARDFGPGILAQKSLQFEAKRTSFWSARH